MTSHAQYIPGPASGAQMRKEEGENWTLILVRELRHSPEKVWQGAYRTRRICASGLALKPMGAWVRLEPR